MPIECISLYPFTKAECDLRTFEGTYSETLTASRRDIIFREIGDIRHHCRGTSWLPASLAFFLRSFLRSYTQYCTSVGTME